MDKPLKSSGERQSLHSDYNPASRMDVTEKRVIYAIAALVSISLIALSVTTLVSHYSTTDEPEKTPEKKCEETIDFI